MLTFLGKTGFLRETKREPVHKVLLIFYCLLFLALGFGALGSLSNSNFSAVDESSFTCTYLIPLSLCSVKKLYIAVYASIQSFAFAMALTHDITVRAGKYGMAKPDYSGLSRYGEAFLNFVKNKLPEEIEDYLRGNSKDCIPRSRINRDRTLKYIFCLVKRYRKRCKNRLYPGAPPVPR